MSAVRVRLRANQLHPALADPMVESMNFLNEVMARFPDAISFGPGAPDERFFETIDVGRSIARFTAHLATRRGLDAAEVRRALYQYGPSRGLINDLVAEALGRDEDITVRPADVVVTVGCQEALFLVVRVLCGSPTDVLAVVDPAYVGIIGAAKLLGTHVAPVRGGPSGVDVESLRAVCAAQRRAGRRVRVLYVAPDFANPSGERMGLDTRLGLLDEADRQDLLVVEDSAYRFTADRGLPTLKALDGQGRVIHCGTFAKVCLPGARVGYVVADQPVGDGRSLADALATAKSMVTVNTAPIAQAVVGGMLLEHGCSLAALAREKAARYRSGLARLLAALDRTLGADPVPGVSWNAPAGGFFVSVTLPVPVDDALLDRSAREYGVLWTPLRHFYLGAGGTHRLRLSCSYLTDARIDEGAARLARFVRDAAGAARDSTKY